MSIKLGNTGINKRYLGGTEINKVYLGDTVIFGGVIKYYLMLDAATDDKTTFNDFLTSEVVGKDEYSYKVFFADMPAQTSGTGSVFLNSWGAADAFGIIRVGSTIRVHHNTSAAGYALVGMNTTIGDLTDVTVTYSFGTLSIFYNGVFSSSVSGLSNVATIGGGFMAIGDNAIGYTSIGYEKIHFNDKIISLNEGSGINVSSGDNSITGVITTTSIDPNHIDDFIWQEL